MHKTFTIGELAKKAGVSIRTIRFYIDEGLIPPPRVRGRNTLYGEEYLDRISLILRLKEAYLPLREIQQKMAGLGIEAVRELLGQQDVKSAVRNASQKSDQFLKEPALQHIDGESTSAMDYIARILEAHIPAPNRSKPGIRQLEQRPAPASPPWQGGVPNPALQPQTSWQHILLAPGVELHVSQQAMMEKQMVIQRLLELARQLFESKLV
ncbi:MAG: MerR family transcriptional regulator [Anaerolineaceae bacterium]|nr:MerR family transcriptional regulator [Anaerolineaceae bacterium]